MPSCRLSIKQFLWVSCNKPTVLCHLFLVVRCSYNNPYSKINRKTHNPSLKITTIVLPKNIRTFNTGASLQKWKTKRPAVKSKQKLSSKAVASEEDENWEVYDDFILKDCDNVEQEIMDPDVHRLPSSSGSSEDVAAEKGKKSKKKKKSKIIRVSLSRPPSPETIQVIRVDVVSNFSVEEIEHDVQEDEEKIGRKSRRNKELVLKCNKLPLATRS